MYKARVNLHEIDTIRFLGKKLWPTMLKEIKEFQTLEILKLILSL